MRIALVNPPHARAYERQWAGFPLLGLAYIASSLRSAGHDVQVLDGKLERLSVDVIVERIAAHPIDLVGITSMTVEYPQAARIARRIKSLRDLPIVVGGAHANGVGAQALEECPAFDFACIGEGERLACELVDCIAGSRRLEAVDGLAFRQSDRIVQNRARSYLDDYDVLPFPAWDLFRLGEQVPILTHRGCPFRCSFCSHNMGFAPRYRSPENVLDELSEVVQRYHPKTIRFEDETFGLSVPRTKQILCGILERGLQRQVAFSAQTRVDRIDRELVRLLDACHFETLEVGVESGNEEVLRRINKGITLNQVRTAVELARSANLKVWCKFILGHPFETPDTIRDTIRFIAELNPDRLSVAVMTPFPGTPIYDMALRGEGGYRLLSSRWSHYDKYGAGALELESVPLAQLKMFQMLAYARLYIQNGRLRELGRLALGHWRLGVEMALGVVTQPARRHAPWADRTGDTDSQRVRCRD